MTRALVVDDSTVDRELVRSLLMGESSLEVAFAGNGVEALEQIRKQEPQIIITDLHMPKMNGLQLVEAVHRNHTAVPIVLITGNGSEALAVEALKKGASNYVPKAAIGRDLVPTVMHTLAVSRAQHNLQQLRNCWSSTRCSFEIPNDYNLISPMVQQLMQIVEGMQLFDQTERVQLAVALEEAVSNALYHGNLELTYEQVHSVGYDLFAPDSSNIVDERRSSSPYQERRVHVEATLNRREVSFKVSDEGHGFDQGNIPAPEKVVSSDEVRGRGLTKMRLFTDELQFSDKGNEVTLVKRTIPRANNEDEAHGK